MSPLQPHKALLPFGQASRFLPGLKARGFTLLYHKRYFHITYPYQKRALINSEYYYRNIGAKRRRGQSETTQEQLKLPPQNNQNHFKKVCQKNTGYTSNSCTREKYFPHQVNTSDIPFKEKHYQLKHYRQKNTGYTSNLIIRQKVYSHLINISETTEVYFKN
jgi:hypothetical protein